MAGEEQERFEDYLELERYIEALQTGRRARLPRDLTPGQARIYRMAVLFRSASPEAATPRPEFMDELYERLLALDKEQSEQFQEETVIPELDKEKDHDPPQTPVVSTPLPDKYPEVQETEQQPKKRRIVSRRSLLTGGAVAVASLATGAGIGTMLQQTGNQEPPSTNAPPWVPLVTNETPAQWVFVGTVEQVSTNVLRFATNTIIGYVLRNEEESGNSASANEQVIAMSAACTHMGCIVHWSEEKHQFVCPCHDGRFSATGKPATGKTKYYAPLPRLETRIEDGKIYVKVPTIATT